MARINGPPLHIIAITKFFDQSCPRHFTSPPNSLVTPEAFNLKVLYVVFHVVFVKLGLSSQYEGVLQSVLALRISCN